MEKPADRTKQAGPAGAACRFYPDQLASIGFTYEHERWALTMASTAVRWRWGCVRARVFLSVCECQACPKPSVRQAEGIGQHPQRSAGSRQAGRLDVAHSHATESARITCNITQHPPRKLPQTRTHRACNMP